MRLTTFILFVCCITASATGNSQTVSLSAENVPLEKVLERIKEQTGYSFLYGASQLQAAKKITLHVRNAKLEEVLKLCFANQPLTYTIIDKTIVVKNIDAVERPHVDVPAIITAPPPITVKGRITLENGEPVAASITVKNTQQGTTTNADGFFELPSVEENAVLVITGTSIEPLEIRVNGRTSIAVVTKLKVTEGDEVIVSTGYWSTKKRLSTGNITKITAKEIGNQPVTSPLMALQGRVPGLEITPRTGAPGSAPIVHIRGTNSLRGTDEYFHDPNGKGNFPLYVIDGVPVDANPVQSITSVSSMAGGFDPLSFINPQNIESIEVLKDGDATAIYGSRGANGVILITTKQGKSLAKTSFDLNVYRGVGKVSKKLELLSTEQYVALRKEAFLNDNETPTIDNAQDLLLWDTLRYTDWQDVFLGGRSDITDINATISGGNAHTSFRIGGGFHKETTILPGNAFIASGSFQASLNHLSPNKKFSTGFVFNYGLSNQHFFSDYDFIRRAFRNAPNAPALYTSSGALNWEPKPSGQSSWRNPLADLERESKSASSTLVVNTNMGYELLPGIVLKVRAGLTQLAGTEIAKTPLATYDPVTLLNAPQNSILSNSVFGANQRFAWNIEPQLDINKQFGNHSFNIAVGSTLQETNTAFQRLQGSFSSDMFMENKLAAISLINTTDDNSRYKYLSFFGRVGYHFKERYVLNLTGRRDGSSRFAANDKFGNFGSVAAAWIFSDEAWSKRNLRFLSAGKLRASFGVTGNDQVVDYKFYSLYNIGPLYNGQSTLYPASLYNPSYSWEVTKKIEAGLQLGFVQNRINVEVSWYLNRSSNQLVSYPLSAVTGFASVLANFDATVENSGVELVLLSTNVSKKDFRWTSSVNFSLPKNRLVKFDGIESSPYARRFKVGESVNIRRLYTWAGVHPQTGLHRYVDVNRDGIINDDDKTFMYPDDLLFFGGVNNSISWRGMELSFLFQCVSRDRVSSNNVSIGYANNNFASNVANRWRKPGDITSVEKATLDPRFTGAVLRGQSDYVIQDATFIRFKTLSLAYALPTKLVQKTGLQSARIYLQAQNLFTITRFENLDPETGSDLPPLRMLTMGLQIKI